MWSTFSVILEAIAPGARAEGQHQLGAVVRELVDREMRRSRSLDEAMRSAARALGITVRRVRAYRYGEVRQVVFEEYRTVLVRYAGWLDREATALEAEAAVLRARRQAMGDG